MRTHSIRTLGGQTLVGGRDGRRRRWLDSSRRDSEMQGPFLRVLNTLTVGVLWVIGVALGFATIVSVLEATRILLDGVLAGRR